MKMPTRRKYVAGAALAAISLPVGGTLFTGWNGRKWKSSSKTHSQIVDGPAVHLENVTSGFNQPVALGNPFNDYLYIADKFGQVYLRSEGELTEEPILDISEDLVMDHGEQGLLGMAFHPNFQDNRKFYVRYSSQPREGTPDGYSHTFVLSEFRISEDFRRVVDGSERPILEIPEPGRMHNAGEIAFGPEGYLYVTVGDGGGDGHDGSGPFNRGANSHAGDWYWVNVGGNGQDVSENLLGSILRIDVDQPEDDRPYSVPDDNPLTDTDGLEEHYAWGFRNPYSISINGGDVFVADAGTRLYEEVNLVEKGGNYGWNVREGPTCHNNFPFLRAFSAVDIDIRSLSACPTETPEGQELIEPIITYPHIPGGVVIGGHVYENTTVPQLEGKYVFGDLRGRLFASKPTNDEGYWDIEELALQTVDQEEPSKQMNTSLLSIDQGHDGELYALTLGADGGEVKRIVNG